MLKVYICVVFWMFVRCSAQWVSVATAVVPGVDKNWKYATEYGELYFNDSGYQYCSNGQNHQWHTLFVDRPQLLWMLAGQTVYNKTKCIQCLANKWVHLDGDSLVRDQYYDLLELVGHQKPCHRVKIHANQHIYIAEYNITITFGFNPGKSSKCPVQRWPSHSRPDVWQWTAGLWFGSGRRLCNETMQEFEKRLECVGRDGQAVGMKTILRTTTPYSLSYRYCGADEVCVQSRQWHNKLHAQQNKLAIGVLTKRYNFEILDAWKILYPRADNLTCDGTHYSGPGSKWLTNVFLQMMCPN